MKRQVLKALVLALLLIAGVDLFAADKQYAFALDYSAIPADIFKKQITISVSVGTAASCNVTADGVSIANNYNAAAGTCWFSLTRTAASVVVTAVNWTAGGTGAATKTTLFNNKKWAYSFTFDDNYAADYTIVYPYFSARNLRAGIGVVTNWIGGGGYLNRTQLDALFNAGWSIINHSVSHPQGTISCSNLAANIGAAKTTLESWYPTNYKNIWYIYPYLEMGYKTCLSTAGYVRGAEGVDGTNYVDNFPTDFYNTYRHGLYANVPAATANGWADSAASNARPVWMITFTHNTVAGSGSPGTYDTNQATLESHINYVYTTYGEGGTTKNMWFAPSDEVLMYLYTRQYLVISAVAVQTPTNTPIIATHTFTPSKTYTWTATVTHTATRTITASPINTATHTPTVTLTSSRSATASPTFSPVNTATFTATVSSTHTATTNPTETFTETKSCTQTQTPAISSTGTSTAQPTHTATLVHTDTATLTATPQHSATLTATATPTSPAAETSTNTPLSTATNTPADTSTVTPQPTKTNTSQPSATNTFTAVIIPSATVTPTSTATKISTAVPTQTNTPAVPSPTFTPTAAATQADFRVTVENIYPNPYYPAKSDVKLIIHVNNNSGWYSLKIYTSAFRLVRNIPLYGNPAAGRDVLTANRRNFAGLSGGTYYYALAAVSDKGATVLSKPGYIMILNTP